uniref:C2H2-type domain-containing protein n=1 Tax=Anopheles epiroticus TaxID=199890 RepID=A0A182P0P0_9DIPT
MAANEESSFEYAIVQIKEEALSDPEEAIPATTNNNYSENGYKKGSKPRRSTRTAGRPSVRNVKQEPNNNTLKTKASKWSTDAEAVSQYQCEHCHETFDSNSRLSRHKRQHRYENCPICAKKIQIDFLKYHIGQMHAGGKEPTVANLPYQCALCEKSFYYANHLQKHKQVHEKKSCPVCGESFRQSYLKYHMTRMHPTDAANPVKYRCSACKETFYDRNLLWAHQQKHKKLSSNHLNSPLHDSPGSPTNPLTYAPSSPYFSSISASHTSGPNDVILPSIFVKIPTQINQQYQQESRLRTHHSTANEIKCEERSESIKSEVADTRVKLITSSSSSSSSSTSNDPLPDIIDNYLNDTDAGVQPEVEPPILRLCDRCPFATLSEVRLNDHRQARHVTGGVESQVGTVETLNCPVCENKFYKATVLELHLAEDHEMMASEVEALSTRRIVRHATQSSMVDSRCAAVESSSEPAGATSNEMQPTNQGKSRIYIKNVQLLKKPDVIAQETRQENDVAQGQGQLLSAEQNPSSTHGGSLQDSHQLSLGEDMLPPPIAQSLDLPPHASISQQPCAVNGNKIFIRSVSLLQNVNFVASAENMLTSGSGNRYNTAPPPPPPPPSYLSMDCANGDGTSSLLDTMNGGYSTGMTKPAPSNSAQSRGSRIYIKNVDILRNPLITLDDPPVSSTNSLSVTFSEPITTSRASSCESIICTSTPPATVVEQQQPSAPEPCLTNTALGPATQTNDQSLLHGTEVSYSAGPDEMGNGNRSLPLTVEQGPQNLLMLFSTSQDGTIGTAVGGDPNFSYLTANTNSNVQNSEYDAHLPTPTVISCDGQQQQTAQQQPPSKKKSKIFIKNISVLKQPTIHLKSVDEVNLMTYDELQLQNILPTVGGMSSQTAMDGNQDPTGTLEQHETRDLLVNTDRTDKLFSGMIEMGDNLPLHPDEGNVVDDNDHDVMDGYHESDLGYGELSDVCDFTEGFNDRDDPGGGEIDLTAGLSTGNEPNGSGNFETETTHCDFSLPATDVTNDIILLQEESDANEKITPNHEWTALETTAGHGTSPLVQDIILQPMDGTEMSVATVASSDRREEDLLLDTQQVINLDPPKEYYRPESETIANSNAIEPEQQVMMAESLAASPEEETISPLTTTPQEPDRPRTRGRPKGAKQTGITKLKKLYTNLTAEEEGYKCDVKDCGVRFRQPDRLEYHRKCHVVGDGTNSIHCPECGSIEYRNWNTLHTHLWREHAIDMELYACHLCSFKTPVLCRLNNTHMKIHSEERNFKCAICGKAFKNNKQLRNHRRWHREPQPTPEPTTPQQQLQDNPPVSVLEEEQPIARQISQPKETAPSTVPTTNDPPLADKQKSTAKSSTLQSSMKCVKCGLRFAGKRQLRTHMDAKHPTEPGEHSTEVPVSKHRCLLCGMVFRTRYLLQSHSAKHSDEKRFKCEHCEYTTNDHNAFRRHKMRHSTKGGHMYKCSYCDYSSIQSTTYRKHLERMHAEVASALLYKCAKCPFVSISEAKYQLHRTKHHEEDASTEQSGQVEQGQVMESVEATESDYQQRQCESVNSDVVIVEQRDIDTGSISASPMEDPTAAAATIGGGGLQIIQHPIIRPAMFANNFSKVDNFYGYQPHHHHQQQQQQLGQSIMVKLPEATPRSMCPSSQVSYAIDILPTMTTSMPVPVSLPVGQIPEQHEYLHLAATTGEVLMRELN